MTFTQFFEGASVPGAPLSALFLSFAIYSFAGWAYESTVCALSRLGHFTNRGFLLGPCCPIYGAGALVCWLLLRNVGNVVVQFVAAAVVCSIIEYAVGCALEAITGAKFWDYTRFPFNIKGRVCLYGALVFGAGTVLVCRVLQPALLYAFGLVPVWLLRGAAAAVAAGMAVDAVCSLLSWRRLSTHLDELRDEVSKRIETSMEDASDSLLEHVPQQTRTDMQDAKARTTELNKHLIEMSDSAMEALRSRAQLPSFHVDGPKRLRLAHAHAAANTRPMTLTRRDLRFFNAFPDLKIPRHEGVLRATLLKGHARELFERKQG